MRGRNIFVKVYRKVRAGNLIFKRREIQRAEGQKIMIQIGVTKDPGLVKWSAANRRAKQGKLALERERKNILARNKKRIKR